VAAFLSLQPSWVMILESTLTRKPPSNQTLIVSRFSRLATSELLRRTHPPPSLLTLCLGIVPPAECALLLRGARRSLQSEHS
jgi:hypothetical protein